MLIKTTIEDFKYKQFFINKDVDYNFYPTDISQTVIGNGDQVIDSVYAMITSGTYKYTRPVDGGSQMVYHNY